jgi:hypothetical protein
MNRDRAWLWALTGFVPAVALRSGTIAEGDTFWQVRTGLDELISGNLMRTDVFSWTATGTPWVQNSWLYNLADAIAYRVGGLLAVSLMAACLGLWIGWLILRVCRVIGAKPLSAGIALAFSSSLLLVALNARPHLIDYAFLIAGVLLLRSLQGALSDTWPLLKIAVMSVLWANLHPATPAFVVVCLAVVGVHALAQDIGKAGSSLLAAILVSGATWLNPYHYAVVTQALNISEEAKVYITEWRGADAHSPAEWVLIVLTLVAAHALYTSGERVVLGSLLACFALHVTAIRFAPFVLVLAIPGVALALSGSRSYAYFVRRKRFFALSAGIAFLVALPALTHIGQPFPGRFPTTTIEAIPSNARLYNADEYGGIVLLKRPDVLVASDGRVEIHGASYLHQVRQSLEGMDDAETLMAEADSALLPVDSVLAAQLSRNTSWVETARDTRAVLFVRTSRLARP